MIIFETEKEKEEREKKGHNEILIKDKFFRDIWTLFEQEEDYLKTKRVSNFWNNNYIESESNSDKNCNLSLDECLNNNIKPYLRDMIIDAQGCDTWKIHLTIAINFISSRDTEEERVISPTTYNIKFTS